MLVKHCLFVKMVTKVVGGILFIASCVSSMPQLPAHPNPAHTFLANPSLSAADPNAAHTAPAAPFQAAHPNPANTFARSDCAKFAGVFPCAIGDDQCAQEYKVSGCGK